MIVYNVGFTNSAGHKDETQLDVQEYNSFSYEVVELVNLILSLKTEMDIASVDYIDFVGEEDELDVC